MRAIGRSQGRRPRRDPLLGQAVVQEGVSSPRPL